MYGTKNILPFCERQGCGQVVRPVNDFPGETFVKLCLDCYVLVKMVGKRDMERHPGLRSKLDCGGDGGSDGYDAGGSEVKPCSSDQVPIELP